MRLGGVLSDPVSESTDEVRQVAAAIAVLADGLLAGNRTAVLRAASGQDADRDAHPGHAAERQQLQLALPRDKHPDKHVTLCLAAASFRIILHDERRRRGARRRPLAPILIDDHRVAGEPARGGLAAVCPPRGRGRKREVTLSDDDDDDDDEVVVQGLASL